VTTAPSCSGASSKEVVSGYKLDGTPIVTYLDPEFVATLEPAAMGNSASQAWLDKIRSYTVAQSQTPALSGASGRNWCMILSGVFTRTGCVLRTVSAMNKLIAAALASVSIGAALAVTSAVSAPIAAADIPSNCVQQFWMVGLRSATRTICDGPIRADGSWLRERSFFAPASIAPGYSTCYGYGFCTFYPAREIAEYKVSDQYPVTGVTVLPDEPPHIDAAGTVA